MEIKVKLFAIARAAAGDDEITLHVEDQATIARVRDALVDRIPELEPLRDSLRFAVNEDYAGSETVVRDDDEVACIPPVSGG